MAVAFFALRKVLKASTSTTTKAFSLDSISKLFANKPKKFAKNDSFRLTPSQCSQILRFPINWLLPEFYFLTNN